MMKTKKSSKGLALVLAAVLALTPMAGFPLTALATGEAATPKAEAPVTDAADAPAVDAGETPQVDASTTDADTNTDATPGTTPSTPAVDAETPQAEAPATDATQPAVPAPPTSAAIALTAPTAAVESAASEGDVVINELSFPDKNFREYVREKFDKTKDGILDTDEIKGVKWILVQKKGIATLQGIEYFTALNVLRCDNNQLTSLDVSNNTALNILHCYNNQLASLNVSNNTALKTLECQNNRLTTLNLPASDVLTRLLCSDNQLTSLDASNNTALSVLECANNQLTTLGVSANKALTKLICSDNQLTTLNLPASDVLTRLLCSGNNLTILDLKNLAQLSEPILSPQRSDVVIPVVKRDTYEVDAGVFSGLSNVAIDGQPLAADGKLELSEPPKLVTYTFEADSPVLSDVEKTVKVGTYNFAYSYLATLDAGTNGTLTFDGAPSASGEILLAKRSEPTFTVTPASGYQVATLTVNGEDAMGSLGGETLTLPPVTDAVAIAATFKEIPAPPIVNYYSVTATAENGTITSDHAAPVREGSSVKCTFSPKEGYALESVSVNGKAVEATEDSTATNKTYSHTINSIYSDTTIHVVFEAVEPPVDPTDPVDPPKPPVDPTDPVDPPKPPVDPADPINPPIPPAVPDSGGNGNDGNNNNGTTTIVERTNTVTVPVAPQAAALAAPETPATAATAAAKTEATPARAAADNAAPQGQLENPPLGAQALDMQHSHLPLALLLLAVWLVGGFAVIRQRKHTHDAIEGTSY